MICIGLRYIKSDSLGAGGYLWGFAEIGEKFGPFDIAFLPIGAYEPRWY
ncbi:MAG: hypothetical protein OEV42_01990 [Deltaproteobacteria bacterium]|nr:hypothetical protein [Deltaproteobacteria bacterium]